MRRLSKTIRTSLAALLGDGVSGEAASSDFQRVNAIRSEMLKVLGVEVSASHNGLRHRIEWADGAEALWYLRSEMMMALSETQGEVEAQKCMTVITGMFLGLVSGASASKRKGPPSLRRR